MSRYDTGSKWNCATPGCYDRRLRASVTIPAGSGRRRAARDVGDVAITQHRVLRCEQAPDIRLAGNDPRVQHPQVAPVEPGAVTLRRIGHLFTLEQPGPVEAEPEMPVPVIVVARERSRFGGGPGPVREANQAVVPARGAKSNIDGRAGSNGCPTSVQLIQCVPTPCV